VPRYLLVNESGGALGGLRHPEPILQPGDVILLDRVDRFVVLAVRESENGDGRLVLVVRPLEPDDA
jgi:hypothetical protein